MEGTDAALSALKEIEARGDWVAHAWRERMPELAPLREQGWETVLPGSGQYAGPEALVWDAAERAAADVQNWARELGGALLWAGFSSGGGWMALNAVLSGALPAAGVRAVAPSLPACPSPPCWGSKTD